MAGYPEQRPSRSPSGVPVETGEEKSSTWDQDTPCPAPDTPPQKAQPPARKQNRKAAGTPPVPPAQSKKKNDVGAKPSVGSGQTAGAPDVCGRGQQPVRTTSGLGRAALGRPWALVRSVSLDKQPLQEGTSGVPAAAKGEASALTTGLPHSKSVDSAAQAGPMNQGTSGVPGTEGNGFLWKAGSTVASYSGSLSQLLGHTWSSESETTVASKHCSSLHATSEDGRGPECLPRGSAGMAANVAFTSGAKAEKDSEAVRLFQSVSEGRRTFQFEVDDSDEESTDAGLDESEGEGLGAMAAGRSVEEKLGESGAGAEETSRMVHGPARTALRRHSTKRSKRPPRHSVPERAALQSKSLSTAGNSKEEGESKEALASTGKATNHTPAVHLRVSRRRGHWSKKSFDDERLGAAAVLLAGRERLARQESSEMESEYPADALPRAPSGLAAAALAQKGHLARQESSEMESEYPADALPRVPSGLAAALQAQKGHLVRQESSAMESEAPTGKLALELDVPVSACNEALISGEDEVPQAMVEVGPSPPATSGSFSETAMSGSETPLGWAGEEGLSSEGAAMEPPPWRQGTPHDMSCGPRPGAADSEPTMYFDFTNQTEVLRLATPSDSSDGVSLESNGSDGGSLASDGSNGESQDVDGSDGGSLKLDGSDGESQDRDSSDGGSLKLNGSDGESQDGNSSDGEGHSDTFINRHPHPVLRSPADSVKGQNRVHVNAGVDEESLESGGQPFSSPRIPAGSDEEQQDKQMDMKAAVEAGESPDWDQLANDRAEGAELSCVSVGMERGFSPEVHRLVLNEAGAGGEEGLGQGQGQGLGLRLESAAGGEAKACEVRHGRHSSFSFWKDLEPGSKAVGGQAGRAQGTAEGEDKEDCTVAVGEEEWMGGIVEEAGGEEVGGEEEQEEEEEEGKDEEEDVGGSVKEEGEGDGEDSVVELDAWGEAAEPDDGSDGEGERELEEVWEQGGARAVAEARERQTANDEGAAWNQGDGEEMEGQGEMVRGGVGQGSTHGMPLRDHCWEYSESSVESDSYSEGDEEYTAEADIFERVKEDEEDTGYRSRGYEGQGYKGHGHLQEGSEGPTWVGENPSAMEVTESKVHKDHSVQAQDSAAFPLEHPGASAGEEGGRGVAFHGRLSKGRHAFEAQGQEHSFAFPTASPIPSSVPDLASWERTVQERRATEHGTQGLCSLEQPTVHRGTHVHEDSNSTHEEMGVLTSRADSVAGPGRTLSLREGQGMPLLAEDKAARRHSVRRDGRDRGQLSPTLWEEEASGKAGAKKKKQQQQPWSGPLQLTEAPAPRPAGDASGTPREAEGKLLRANSSGRQSSGAPRPKPSAGSPQVGQPRAKPAVPGIVQRALSKLFDRTGSRPSPGKARGKGEPEQGQLGGAKPKGGAAGSLGGRGGPERQVHFADVAKGKDAKEAKGEKDRPRKGNNLKDGIRLQGKEEVKEKPAGSFKEGARLEGTTAGNTGHKQLGITFREPSERRGESENEERTKQTTDDGTTRGPGVTFRSPAAVTSTAETPPRLRRTNTVTSTSSCSKDYEYLQRKFVLGEDSVPVPGAQGHPGYTRGVAGVGRTAQGRGGLGRPREPAALHSNTATRGSLAVYQGLGGVPGRRSLARSSSTLSAASTAYSTEEDLRGKLPGRQAAGMLDLTLPGQGDRLAAVAPAQVEVHPAQSVGPGEDTAAEEGPMPGWQEGSPHMWRSRSPLGAPDRYTGSALQAHQGPPGTAHCVGRSLSERRVPIPLLEDMYSDDNRHQDEEDIPTAMSVAPDCNEDVVAWEMIPGGDRSPARAFRRTLSQLAPSSVRTLSPREPSFGGSQEAQRYPAPANLATAGMGDVLVHGQHFTFAGGPVVHHEAWTGYQDSVVHPGHSPVGRISIQRQPHPAASHALLQQEAGSREAMLHQAHGVQPALGSRSFPAQRRLEDAGGVPSLGSSSFTAHQRLDDADGPDGYLRSLSSGGEQGVGSTASWQRSRTTTRTSGGVVMGCSGADLSASWDGPKPFLPTSSKGHTTSYASLLGPRQPQPRGPQSLSSTWGGPGPSATWVQNESSPDAIPRASTTKARAPHGTRGSHLLDMRARVDTASRLGSFPQGGQDGSDPAYTGQSPAYTRQDPHQASLYQVTAGPPLEELLRQNPALGAYWAPSAPRKGPAVFAPSESKGAASPPVFDVGY